MANNDHIPAHVLPYLDQHIHRLILTNELRDYHGILCQSCQTPVRSGWSYACLPCKYAIHNQCPDPNIPQPSILLPKTNIFNETEVKISGLTTQKLIANGSYPQCLRCGERCTGSIKSDCSNGFGCHESCSLLPKEIQHPLHNHTLELEFPKLRIRNPCFYPSESCYLCGSKLRKQSSSRVYQVYRCKLCSDFYIHIECAYQMTMIKHSAHEHPLIFLRVKGEVGHRYYEIECDWCGGGWSELMVDFGVYRCVVCDFSMHECCFKYQRVIVNEDEHQHPLEYVPPSGRGARRGDVYEWSEGDYCEACGEDIAQDEPIYKCLSCPNEFLFHRDCAIASSQELVEQDDLSQPVQELCERNAHFPAKMFLLERMSESVGKIESLTLDLEEDIRLLTSLKFISKELG